MSISNLFVPNSHNLFSSTLTALSGITITSTTESTSSDSGSLIVSGGLGVAKNIILGGDIYSEISETTKSFTGACPLTNTLKILKIGQIVYVHFPLTTDNATTSDYFYGTDFIPLVYRPSNALRKSIFVTNEGLEVVGSLTINTVGDITVFNGSSSSFNGVCGFGLNISYII